MVDTSQPIFHYSIRPRVSEMSPTAVLLILAIASEAQVFKTSGGFGRLAPSALAVLGCALAFHFLAQSLKYIPLAAAYAIWLGMDSVLLGR